MTRLSATKVKALSKPGLHGDGGTLYLKVAPGGSKSWVQRVRVHGRRRDIGLGGYPAVSLAQAREKALENRSNIAGGGDPLTQQDKNRVPTFREAVHATFEANRPRLRNAKVLNSWMQSMEKHALPALGHLRVDEIGRAEVLAVLTPIWTLTPETARKVRRRIRAALAWCQAHEFIEHNPAGEMIDAALPPMPSVGSHHRALPHQEVAAALNAVDSTGASRSAKLCLRFLVLTAARSGEARGAMWNEVCLDQGVWRVPAKRMKSSVEHRVPLSDAARHVLDAARELHDGSGLIFPSPVKRKSGHPMSDVTLIALLRRSGLADRTVVHGFRSSFRSWAQERADADYAAMEMSLAHTVGSAVERAYARSDLLEKRRILMQLWGDYVTRSPNN